jgi:hypothetical protein
VPAAQQKQAASHHAQHPKSELATMNFAKWNFEIFRDRFQLELRQVLVFSQHQIATRHLPSPRIPFWNQVQLHSLQVSLPQGALE